MEGAVEGSSPHWTVDGNGGRSRDARSPAAELGEKGFAGFYSETRDPFNTSRKHFGASFSASCDPVSEPLLSVDPKGGYYERRKQSNTAAGYRPHVAQVRANVEPERPSRRRHLAGPQPSAEAPLPGGVRVFQPKLDPGHMDLPPLPRLAHPGGMHAAAEGGGAYLSLEREFARKARCVPEMYRGLGRAGDLSATCGCPRRPEDEPSFYRTPKDSPTFVRFLNSCEPPPPVPHSVRRQLWYEQRDRDARQAEIDLVRELDSFDPEAPPKRMEPDPDEDDPEDAAAGSKQQAASAAKAKKPRNPKKK
mmetsp:Transcript_30588/g.72817  ORF Transcript_30588/g.72817 Transcript_30588/m.72817 type:complete len:306 (+) Transcript_30588:878-1795(+)